MNLNLRLAELITQIKNLIKRLDHLIQEAETNHDDCDDDAEVEIHRLQ